MRFMMMHKMTESLEKGVPPEPAVLEAIGAMVADAAQKGQFLGGEGLKSSSERLLVTYKDGRRSIAQGPFSDPRELPAGFMLLRVRSQEEALSWLDRFAAAMGDVTLFVGAVCEPWDLGFAPRPEGAPLRFLAMPQADARSESETPSDAQRAARLAALADDMKSAGVLEASAQLASTKRGARIRFQGKQRSLIDGPFAESKELIAGYALFELPSKAEAIARASAFAELVKVDEIDVREVLAG